VPINDPLTQRSSIVWTNEEGDENGSVTTVTLQEKETFTQLDELLIELSASVVRS
jgi:hypothetical protein